MITWTRTVCLKTRVVLQTVSKDCSYFIKVGVCFQELHIIVQSVTYEKIISVTKNKRLLNVWRKYITFKSKQWLNLRIKMSLSFSQILLLKKFPLRLFVESFTRIMSTANTEFPSWRKPLSFTKYLRQTLVFVPNSALQEKLNFCFSRDFY